MPLPPPRPVETICRPSVHPFTPPFEAHAEFRYIFPWVHHPILILPPLLMFSHSLTLTRTIKSVVTGQAPITLELRNTPGEKHKQTKGGTRIYHS